MPTQRLRWESADRGSETANGSRRAFSGLPPGTAEALATALPTARVLEPASRCQIGSRLEGKTTVMSGMYLAATSLTLKRNDCASD